MAERTEELKRDIEQTRTHMTGTLEAIGDRVSPGRIAERRWTGVRRSTTRMTTSIMGTPRVVASKASAAGGDLLASTGGAASSTTEALGHAPEQLKGATAGNPIAAGAVAFGIGVLIGSLAPPSDAEVHVADQVVEPLQRELTDAGKQIAEVAKQQAQEGAQRTKEVATEAASDVKDSASEAASTVKEQSGSAKDEVAGEAKDAARQISP
ncbi:MAG: hypothetical protein JWM89_330 [Acidimicrobiales bacterium]|nr:hypothetical protein [Acidimicrobiales bacterium]